MSLLIIKSNLVINFTDLQISYTYHTNSISKVWNRKNTVLSIAVYLRGLSQFVVFFRVSVTFQTRFKMTSSQSRAARLWKINLLAVKTI